MSNRNPPDNLPTAGGSYVRQGEGWAKQSTASTGTALLRRRGRSIPAQETPDDGANEQTTTPEPQE